MATKTFPAGSFDAETLDQMSEPTLIAIANRIWPYTTNGQVVRARGGSLDDSANIQAAIDANPNGDVLIPDPQYNLETGLIIATGQTTGLKGSGKTLLFAKTTDMVAVWVKKDITYLNAQRIDGLHIYGSSAATGITGLRIGETTTAVGQPGARLNSCASNCIIQKCYIGLDYVEMLEGSVHNMQIVDNDIGLVITSGTTNGGANANTFYDVHLKSNKIGLFALNKAAWEMAGNRFVGGSIQGSETCGVAVVGPRDIVFAGTHMEANAVDTGVASVDFLGETIPRMPHYAKNSAIEFDGVYNAETISPSVQLINSVFRHKDMGAGGSLIASYVTADSTSTIEYDGPQRHHGYCTGPISRWPTGVETEQPNGWALVGLPTMFETTYPPNIYNFADSQTPTLSSVAAEATLNANITDPVIGDASSITFGSEIGSTAVNRFLFATFPANLDVGDWAMVSFLAKSTVEGAKFRFGLVGSGNVPFDAVLSTEWRRVFMAVKATVSTSFQLFVYPQDTQAATVYFAKMHCYRATSKNEFRTAASLLLAGAYTPQAT